MKQSTDTLFAALVEATKQSMNDAETLNALPLDMLNQKADASSWSALECVEHLNRYGDFYLPEVRTRITQSQTTPHPVFKSQFLGDYFAKSVAPEAKKMKTFKSMDPAGSNLTLDVLDRFITQQQEWLTLIDQARKVNLMKVKTAISISKIIKLKLGDTFRVNINHNRRHMLQALRAVGQGAE